MRTIRRYGKATMGLLSATTALGCGGQAPEEGELDVARQAFVFAPVLGPSTTGNLPALPNGPGNVESGAFIQGDRLSAAPAEIAEPWLFETVGDEFSVAPAFPQRMLDATFATGAGLNEYWSDNLFLDRILEWVDPTTPPLGGPPVPKTFGYKPERARWLAAQRTSSGLSTFNDPEKFGELRWRGLRLYCAARSARQANSQTAIMGKRSLASITILGKRIDFLSLEPTVSLAAPQKFDSGATDGAQAFVIPFAGGVRVTPISLFRSLPELRAPVLMLTADSEVRSRSNTSGANYKEWQTVTHIDGFASGNQIVAQKESPRILLVTIGPIPIYGKFGVTLEIASCSQATSMSTCKSNARRPVERLLQGIQFGGVVNPMPSPWPTPRTPAFGFTTAGALVEGSRDEASWIINGDNASVRRNSGSAWIMPYNLNSPMITRALQDNDKSMELRTGVTLTSEISTGASFEQWPLRISATISGTIGANASVVHSFREQEEIVMRRVVTPEFTQLVPDPTTGLTVTPRTEGTFTFGTNASLTIAIRDIPIIGTLSKTVTVWNASAETATTPTRWPEHNRLRIETARQQAGTFHAGERSHWPGPGSFASYPPEGILSCLTSSVPVSDLPPTCASKAPFAPPGGSTTAPSGDVCVYMPTSQDADWTGAEFSCFRALQTYARRVTTWQQNFQGQMVDAHPIGYGSQADRTALQAAIATCATQFGTENPATVGSRLQSWVRMTACDPSVRRLFASAASSAATLNDTPALTPGTCQ